MTPTRIWFLYAILLVLSVPWYWPRGSAEWLVLGVPIWAAVSIACYVAAALLTATTIDVLWRAQVGDDGDGEG